MTRRRRTALGTEQVEKSPSPSAIFKGGCRDMKRRREGTLAIFAVGSDAPFLLSCFLLLPLINELRREQDKERNLGSRASAVFVDRNCL